MSLFSKKKKSKPISRIGLVNSKFPFAIREAYKTLHTNIVYSGIDASCKKIAVTSAVPSEGKSTVASNLACTIAQNSENARVLLIDADLRAPALCDIFSIDPATHGLSDYLAGVDHEPNFIYFDDYKVSVLPSGNKPVNPTQLLSSSTLGELLKFCEEKFDYIIIDTPPINVVTDAFLFNNHVHGYIISVLSDYSDSKNVAECIDALEQVKANIMGFVLSGVKLKSNTGRYNYIKHAPGYANS